jgi:hypothetical protein
MCNLCYTAARLLLLLLLMLLLLLLCSCFRGYVGTWTSFAIQHSNTCNTGSSEAAPPPAADADAAHAAHATPVFVDETVNFRLFRMEDPATMKYHQVGAAAAAAVNCLVTYNKVCPQLQQLSNASMRQQQ